MFSVRSGEQDDKNITVAVDKNPNRKSDGIPPELSWKVGAVPDKVQVAPNSLKVDPNFKTDFWRNTYYDPILQAYNGHVLGLDTTEENFVAETRFTFRPSVKFDQAGLFVGVDQTTWIKAGVEYVDGCAWQSVVVTRNDYSDWSKAKQAWPEGRDVCLKLYRQKQSFVIDVSDDNGVTYDFVRIAHLPVTGQVTVGMMICRPPSEEEAGATASAEHCGDFKYFKFLENQGYHHSA